MDAQRALLDQLMGESRNMDAEEAEKFKVRWSDKDICLNWLCGLCPHELFTNTKSDLGPCANKHPHGEQVKEDFLKEPERIQKRQLTKYAEYLEYLVSDVDRRKERGNSRLTRKIESTDIDVQINELHGKITVLQQQMEDEGEKGNVDEAQGMMKLIEPLQEEKKELEDNKRGIDEKIAETDNQMQVCEICGVFILEEAQRKESHLQGKQHIGYQLIRDKLAETRAKIAEPAKEGEDTPKPRERERERGGDRDKRDRGRDRDRERTSSRSSRDSRDNRERGREKGGRGRDRDRERGRENRDRGRERGRDRERESKRDRGRDRDRDRERESSKRRRRDGSGSQEDEKSDVEEGEGKHTGEGEGEANSEKGDEGDAAPAKEEGGEGGDGDAGAAGAGGGGGGGETDDAVGGKPESNGDTDKESVVESVV